MFQDVSKTAKAYKFDDEGLRMEKSETVKMTQELVIKELQLATDYKYINGRGGQLGMSVLHGNESQATHVVVHIARVQFQPAVGDPGLNTTPVNTVLASFELSLDGATTLHSMLGDLLQSEAPPEK